MHWQLLAAWGGAGVFIDFCIGERGQVRVRGWFETWWIKFSYVKWGNLAREEARFAVRLIDRLCGSRIFSFRRFISTFILALFAIVIVALLFMLRGYTLDAFKTNIYEDEVPLFALLVTIFTIPISFSITRIIAVNVLIMMVSWPRCNIIGLIVLFMTQYLMLMYWSIFVVLYHEVIALTIIDFYSAGYAWKGLLKDIYPVVRNKYDIIDFWPSVSLMVGLLPNLMRLCITATFIGMFLLKPSQGPKDPRDPQGPQDPQGPLLTLWARIVESDKPIFTLLFGGSAAFAKLVQEIVKTLW